MQQLQIAFHMLWYQQLTYQVHFLGHPTQQFKLSGNKTVRLVFIFKGKGNWRIYSRCQLYLSLDMVKETHNHHEFFDLPVLASIQTKIQSKNNKRKFDLRYFRDNAIYMHIDFRKLCVFQSSNETHPILFLVINLPFYFRISFFLLQNYISINLVTMTFEIIYQFSKIPRRMIWKALVF